MWRIVIALAIMFGSSQAWAEDFETTQINTKIKVGNIDFENRQTSNSDSDHIQLGYTYEGYNIQLRHVDKEDAETRIRATKKVLDTEYLYGKARVEYRMFEDADDYFRIRPIIGLKLYDGVSTKAYIEHQSSFNFDRAGEENDMKMDAGQLKIGVKQRSSRFLIH